RRAGGRLDGEDPRALAPGQLLAQERPVDSAHLATDEAEIFVVREKGLVLVAVTARFVLASLTGFDLRMALRDLSKGAENA
ncbi:MAG: hypothetical protein WBP55_09875, partial [Solirubrobacterales bacterium]